MYKYYSTTTTTVLFCCSFNQKISSLHHHYIFIIQSKVLGTVRAGQSWKQAIEVDQNKKLKKLVQEKEKKLNKRAKRKQAKKASLDETSSPPLPVIVPVSPVVTRTIYDEDDDDEVLFYSKYTELDSSKVKPHPLSRAMGVSAAITAANLITAGSLCLEFIQLATFPFQSDPSNINDDAITDDEGSTSSNEPPKWLRHMYGISYGVDFSAFDADDCKYILFTSITPSSSSSSFSLCIV